MITPRVRVNNLCVNVCVDVLLFLLYFDGSHLVCVFYLHTSCPCSFSCLFWLAWWAASGLPWTRPPLCILSVSSSISLFYFHCFFSPVLWILLFMDLKFWDCFFVQVSLDICLLNHCPDSVSYVHTLQCESRKFWSCFFYHEFINPELFTQLWPVKYAETHSCHSQRHDWSVAQELLIVYIFVRAGTEIMANPNEVF